LIYLIDIRLIDEIREKHKTIFETGNFTR
jgi:hypothetical protein